jgi:hypothetical protein
MPLTDNQITTFVKKIIDLTDTPSENMSPADLKAYFDSSPEELRVAVNGLIDDLISTTAGASGAKQIGVETISGLTGNDVQSLLTALKTKLDTKTDNAGNHAGTWQGLSPGEASEAVNGGRLDVVESQLADIATNVNTFKIQTLEVDDTGRFQRALDYCSTNNRLLFIPKGEYTVGSLSVNCSILGYDAILLPNSNNITVLNTTLKYSEIRGIRVNPNGKTGVTGIEINESNVVLRDVLCSGLSKGFVVKSWQVTLDNCQAIGGEIGVYGYGSNGYDQINDLKITGGAYHSNSQYSVWLGDTSQADATTNNNPHGVTITLEKFSCDDAPIKIDYCWNINIKSIHIEGSTAIEDILDIGNEMPAQSQVKGLTIKNCYLHGAKNGIKLNPNTVENVTIENNVFSSITYKGIYGLNPKHYTEIKNNNWTKFNGVLRVEIATYADGVNPPYRQVNMSPSLQTNIFGSIRDGVGLYRNHGDATLSGRFTIFDRIYGATTEQKCTYPSQGYGVVNGVTNIQGNVSGSYFNFDNPADSYNFRAGDVITVSNNPQGRWVRQVDYENGTLLFNYGTVDGVQTISQVAPTFETVV